MKVICDRGALLDRLNLAGGVVVSRTPKPILTCVKLIAETNALHVVATDMEVGLHISTPRVEASVEGEAVVPADKLISIVRESVDATLTLEVDSDTMHVKGQDSHFKVYGYPAGDFPKVPDFPGEPDFAIQAGQLSQLIQQTIYATARENSRYAINGVLLERDGKKLCVVATDGHRLALARGDFKPANDAAFNAIIPTKALNMLNRILDDPEAEVLVKVKDNQIIFDCEGATLSSTLVDGNFPPYKDVIPKDGDKKATLNTDVFASAVRRGALLTNEESKGVRLSFDSDGLTLSSRAPEMGEAEISVDLPKYDGEAVEIGFNPAYVLDALKVITADQVTLDMKAPNKPGVLRTGPDFLYVIMPVNLS